MDFLRRVSALQPALKDRQTARSRVPGIVRASLGSRRDLPTFRRARTCTWFVFVRSALQEPSHRVMSSSHQSCLQHPVALPLHPVEYWRNTARVLVFVALFLVAAASAILLQTR